MKFKTLLILAAVIAAILPLLLLTTHTTQAGKNSSSEDGRERIERAKQISLEILRNMTLDRPIGAADDLKIERVEIDDLQMAHVRVRQFVGGVPVWEGEAIVHLKADDTLSTITDNLKESIKVNTKPKLTAEDAARIADELYTGAAQKTKEPKVEMWIYRGKDKDYLVYRVEIERIDGSNNPAKPVDFIDAQTGKRVFGYDNLQSGTGFSIYSGNVPIGTSNTGGLYYMENLSRRVGTFDLAFTTTTANRYTDPDDFWNTTYQRPGVDAHYGAEATLSYYQTVHNRNGIDGSGGPGYAAAAANNSIGLISSYVRYGVNHSNSYWTGSYLLYGDGDGVNFYPWVTLDLCGHEVTHGVTQYTAGLTYAAESGALNESMSDVFGTMVERYVRPSNWNWKFAEEAYIAGDAIRYLDNPNQNGYPDHYSLRQYPGACTPTQQNDQCGVHSNSSISNHAFYLIANGGTNRVSGIAVTGIGPDSAARIWYRALSQYMTSGTNFAGARTATLNAATDLFGASSAQYTAVARGWCAIGVGACPGSGTCPSAAAITVGQTVSGTLQSGDCLFTDNSYYDAYTFSGTAGQQIAIAMNSAQFNAYLLLYSGNYPGGTLITQDNNGGGGTNARIPATSGFLTLSGTGTYTILANSNAANEVGGYTLSLTSAVNCTYSINPASQNFAAAGGSGSFSVTTQNGCAWSAASGASWITTSSSGTTGGTVNFSVAQNTSTARSGTITVGGQTFTVNQSAASAGCPSASGIAVGQTVSGILQSGDCLYTDNSYYDAYTFNGTAGQQIAIAMNSAQFNAFLLLFQGSYPGGTFVTQDNNGGGGTNARIPASTGFLTLPATGTYTILANAFAVGETGSYTLSLSTTSPPVTGKLYDFDGDGKADPSVFRPSNGAWYVQRSQLGFTGAPFGQNGDRIVPADYDGDGKTDYAVYRNGAWYLQRTTAGFIGLGYGSATDIPAPADFDGDGKAEICVFRPSNGGWYWYNLATGLSNSAGFGQNGDVPVAADYDGDGRADVAVFRPSNGAWYLLRSQLGFTGITFGQNGDKPVPADYDGDGKTDAAVFRNGTWYLLRSQLGFTGEVFGVASDLPAPADYDGDGKADIAVFRPSTGAWYLLRSQLGFVGFPFGQNGDKPIPNAYVP